MYTAIVIDKISAEFLRGIIKENNLDKYGFQFITPQNTDIPHHMTINLGPFNMNLNPEKILGETAELHIDQIRWCPELGACAAKVIKAQVELKEWPAKYWQEINSINDHPHITTALCKGTKPFLSNLLFNAKETDPEIHYLDEVCVLKGVIEECA